MRATDDSWWDLVVVGAGPAGSATALGALTADPGLRVLLLDREDFPRDKSCGDGIAPHVVDALRTVGAADVVDGWAPVHRLGLARQGTRVERPLARQVWVIPRRVLDERLVTRATAAGARLRRHRVRDVEVGPDGVVLDGSVRARVAVAADGAHSVLAPAVGAHQSRRTALAIRGYAPTQPAWCGGQLIAYGRRRQPSYAWAFDRGDGLSNVGYGELLDRDRPASRELLLEQLEELVPGSVATGDQWRAHHLPLSPFRWRQPDGRVLLTGDAAGLINPMTGEGIYYAVASGILAGRAAARALAGAAPATAGALHRTSVRRLLARHLRHTTVTSRLADLPAVVDAGLRAADRDQRFFDDLVEVGLGQGLITPRVLTGLTRELAGSVRDASRRRSHPAHGPTPSAAHPTHVTTP